MTREEAKNFEWFQVDRKEIHSHIDKIYDDFDLIMQEYQSRIDALQLKYADKFKKIEAYCEEQKDTWEAQANGDHKVYEKILKELNKCIMK